MTHFDAISFDIDQTLIDFNEMLESALQAASDWLFDYSGHRVSINEFQHQRDLVAKSFAGKAVSMLAIRHASFCQIVTARGLSVGTADLLLDVFTRVRFGSVKFMPGARAMLEKLPSGLKVAALTNGNSNPNKLGFGRYFDIIISAEDFPYEKPDQRIFDALLSKLKLTARERVIHVGDCLTNDISGANQAGLKSVWYNPGQKLASPTIKPDFEITHLPELISLLKTAKIPSA